MYVQFSLNSVSSLLKSLYLHFILLQQLNLKCLSQHQMISYILLKVVKSHFYKTLNSGFKAYPSSKRSGSKYAIDFKISAIWLILVIADYYNASVVWSFVLKFSIFLTTTAIPKFVRLPGYFVRSGRFRLILFPIYFMFCNTSCRSSGCIVVQ